MQAEGEVVKAVEGGVIVRARRRRRVAMIGDDLVGKPWVVGVMKLVKC